MREAYLLPEMVQAGAEAYIEVNARHLMATESAVAIYLAMEAIREIAELKQENATVH
mgnify:CR=1 FL=1